MARPKKHDDETRRTMVAAAERLISRDGPDALSLREVAAAAGTTTWAVYSLFGSKDALLAAVATEAVHVLREGLARLPETNDPSRDLVDAGVKMYRGFVVEHPWLFRLAFQRIMPGLELGPEFFTAREQTFATLERKVGRLKSAGLLGRRSVREAAVAFNAMCEGLGNAEVRGGTMAPGDQARIWRDAFTALVRGFGAPAPRGRPRSGVRAPS